MTRLTKPGNTSSWPRLVHRRQSSPAPPAPARRSLVVGLEVEQLGVAALAREHRAQELGRVAQLRPVAEQAEQHVVARRVGDPHEAEDDDQRREQQPVVGRSTVNAP